MINLHQNTKYWAMLALMMTIVFSGSSQQLPYGFKKLYDEKIEIEHAEVIDIIKDQYGFLWIATANGLIRYDGHEMEIYQENPLDSTCLGDNATRSLAKDHLGNIWVGTSGGRLYKYNHRKDQFSALKKDPDNEVPNEVRKFLVDRHHRIWLATNIGLELIDQEGGQRKQYFKKGHPLHDFLINCLVEDEQGRIWIGSGGKGLHLLDPSSGTSYRVDSSMISGIEELHNIIYDISICTNGKIWIADQSTGLNSIDPIQKSFQSYSFSKEGEAKKSHVWKIEPAKDGALWLGTRNEGLIHFDPTSQKTKFFNHDPTIPGSLPSNLVLSLLDTENELWIGSHNGLAQFSLGDYGLEPIPLKTAPKDEFLFRRIAKDHRGYIWVASQGNGVYRYDPKNQQTKHFKHDPNNPNSVASNLVWDLLVDQDGVIWMATHGGVQSFDPGLEQFKTYSTMEKQGPLPTRSLFKDHRGTLWVGSFSGLYRLVKGATELELFNLGSEQISYVVIDLFEDSQKKLWVSVYGVGVYRINLDTESITLFQNKPTDLQSLSNNVVVSFAEDNQKNMWLGTQGGGLNLFVPKMTESDSGYFKHWRPYNSDLPTEIVWDIFPKGQQLWLNTDSGLFTYDMKTQKLNSYQLPGVPRRFNLDPRPDRPNKLFLRAYNRVYHFTPDNINQNEQVPPVFMTHLEINGEEVLPAGHFGAKNSKESVLEETILFTEHIDLLHWQNDLTFQFSALNFIQPEKNQYKFRLEGYDSDWIVTDAWNRRIRYTNISPGNYQFKVMGSNNDDVWNEVGTSLSIHISPPWWMTWWAYFLYAVLLFIAIRTIYNFQLNRKVLQGEALRLKELDAAKTRLFTNVTHEFRTPLTIIMGMVQQIRSDPKRWYNEGLDMIQRNGQQLLQLVNQMLDLTKLNMGKLQLNPQRGELISYLSYLVQAFELYATNKGIQLHFLKEIDQLEMDYDAEELSKVINNLLSNAVKFTPENGHIYVSVRQFMGDDSDLGLGVAEIVVKDTGLGIPESNIPHVFDRFYQAPYSGVDGVGGTGIGLSLVKELVTLMNGRVQVQSKEGEGTTFYLFLPITRAAEPMMPTPKWSKAGNHYAIPSMKNPLVVANGLSNALPPVSTATILLIEDNPDVMRYLASCLESEYHLEYAHNGREGVAQALELMPDLIISDVMMPEMDGYKVTETIKNNDHTSHIPILLLTAKVDRESKIEGLKHGADAYLSKPFDPEELQVRLQQLIQLRQKLQSRYGALTMPVQASNPTLQKNDAFIRKFRQVIEARIDDETFGIAQVTRNMQISRTQLHNKLKALTGKSTSQVIRSIRLQKAHELLSSSDLNVKEVSYAVGFKNATYFSKCFSEEFGLSPSELRKNA